MPPADLDAWLVEYNAATTQAIHGQDADTDSTPHLYCAFCTSYPPSGLTLICRDDGDHGALTRYQRRSSLLTNNGLIIGMVSQSDLLHRAEQRRSDIVRLGRQHVRDGRFCFTQAKNKRRKPVSLELRILAELQAVLDASPIGELTFLVNEYGRPFAVAGFGNKFRAWCDKAGLPERCSSHGLRKAAATVAAENGATAHELMAIFGWLSLKEAERYTRAAERKKLADRGMGRLVPLIAGT